MVALSVEDRALSAIHAPDPQSETRYRLLAAAGFVTLAGLVPYNLVDWEGSHATGMNMLLGWVIVAYSAGRLCWTVAQRRPRFMTVMCFVFIYVFVGIASLAQLVARQYPLDNLDYTATAVTHQLVVLLTGCLALEVGLQVANWRREEGDPPARARWVFSPVRAGAVGIAGALFVSYQVARHGLAAFFVSREQTTALLVGSAPDDMPFYQSTDKALGLVTTFLSQYLVFLALLVILYCRRRRVWDPGGPYQELFWKVLITILVIDNIVMNNPLGNGRWWFCLVLVTLASVYVPVTKRANIVIYTAGALLVLLFAFTYLDAFRTTDRGSTRIVTHGLSSESYPVLQMGINGDAYVAANGHTYGRQLLGATLALVPRRVWPDKPIPTGQLVDPQYLRSASAWTELYVDFGLPGVLVFFAGYGFVIRIIERRAANAPPGAFAAVFPLLATYQLFLLRGSFLPAFGAAEEIALLIAFMLAPRAPLAASESPETSRVGSA